MCGGLPEEVKMMRGRDCGRCRRGLTYHCFRFKEEDDRVQKTLGRSGSVG